MADVERARDADVDGRRRSTAHDMSLGLDSPAHSGVKRIEAVSMTWSAWGLIVAYIGILLVSFSTSLQGQVAYYYQTPVVSLYDKHAQISTVGVVQGIMYTVWKIPIAKIADVFGRTEAFSLSIIFFSVGFAMAAGSKNFGTYVASQIFYSAGFTGTQILQQIFIADSTDLLWRGFWSSLPDLPFIITAWIGSYIANAILGPTFVGQWRWGYGMWAIIIPVSFIPFFLSLFFNERKAKRTGLLPPRPWKGKSFLTFLKELYYAMDIVGLILLSAAFCLLLIPLTLGSNKLATPDIGNPYGKGSYIAMFVIGGLSFIAWPLWEMSPKLAPTPAVPFRLVRNRTVAVGCTISFLYFMAFYLCVFPYYYTWLIVVAGKNVTVSGRILACFNVTSSAISFVVGYLIRVTGHYKYFITAGSCIYLLGIGLLYRYRGEGVSTGALVGIQICMGIGGGFLNVPAQVGVQAVSRHQDVAMVTSLFLTTLELGGAIGQAISGSVWSNQMQAKLTQYLPAETRANASIIYAGLFQQYFKYPLGSPTREAINRSIDESMHKFMIGSIVTAAALIPLSLLMKNVALAKVDQKVRGKVIGNSHRATKAEELEDDAIVDSASQSSGEREIANEKSERL